MAFVSKKKSLNYQNNCTNKYKQKHLNFYVQNWLHAIFSPFAFSRVEITCSPEPYNYTTSCNHLFFPTQISQNCMYFWRRRICQLITFHLIITFSVQYGKKVKKQKILWASASFVLIIIYNIIHFLLTPYCSQVTN